MSKSIKKAAKSAASSAKGAKKAVRRNSKAYKGDRLGQFIAILATVMAGGYIIIRIIGWVRFTGV